jgi:tetraacyldisaccharide-1-P 4'-kinase
MFAGMEYGHYYDFFEHQIVALDAKIICVSALADPSKFVDELSRTAGIAKAYTYRDHYLYQDRDVLSWVAYCEANGIHQILTTEKDAVKLECFYALFATSKIQLIVLPVSILMSNEDQTLFFDDINHYINQYH